MFLKNKIITFLLLFFIVFNSAIAEETVVSSALPADIQAVETTQESKYPDYAKMYAGEDKFEKINRYFSDCCCFGSRSIFAADDNQALGA